MLISLPRCAGATPKGCCAWSLIPYPLGCEPWCPEGASGIENTKRILSRLLPPLCGLAMRHLADHLAVNCRRQWQPTAGLLPGKSHGWRSLVGYSPWGGKELDTTERLHFHLGVNKRLTRYGSSSTGASGEAILSASDHLCLGVSQGFLQSRGPQPPSHRLVPPIRLAAVLGQKCTTNVVPLNHPETTPTPVHGKIVFHKTAPWCQKGWGPLCEGPNRNTWGFSDHAVSD